MLGIARRIDPRLWAALTGLAVGAVLGLSAAANDAWRQAGGTTELDVSAARAVVTQLAPTGIVVDTHVGPTPEGLGLGLDWLPTISWDDTDSGYVAFKVLLPGGARVPSDRLFGDMARRWLPESQARVVGPEDPYPFSTLEAMNQSYYVRGKLSTLNNVIETRGSSSAVAYFYVMHGEPRYWTVSFVRVGGIGGAVGTMLGLLFFRIVQYLQGIARRIVMVTSMCGLSALAPGIALTGLALLLSAIDSVILADRPRYVPDTEVWFYLIAPPIGFPLAWLGLLLLVAAFLLGAVNCLAGPFRSSTRIHR